MRGGRGQVTLFIILGLVLLFVVGIVLLLLNRPPSSAPTTLDIANYQVLDSYVGTCVDTIVTDELAEIGRSGGLSVIPPNERNGLPYATARVDGKDVKVLYGITRNRRAQGDLIPWADGIPSSADPDVSSSSLPSIPFDQTDLYWDGVGQRRFDWFLHGYFGEANLIAPCSKSGPNGPGSNMLCRYYPGSPPGTTPEISLQESLTGAAQRRIVECVSLRQFTEAVGQNVTNVSSPNVTVKLTPDNVIVHLDYQLMLKGRTESITVPYERRYGVRLLSITQYAMDLARQETRDINFDISDPVHYKNKAVVPSYDMEFDVTRSPITVSAVNSPADESYRADLVTIRDDGSKLGNKPYQFSFLIEHRPPMVYATADDCLGMDPDDSANPLLEAIPVNGECRVSDGEEMASRPMS